MSWNNYYWGGLRRQKHIGPTQLLSTRDVYTPTATQYCALGTIYETNDGTGRMFRYCKAGSTALTRCFMGASEAPSANGLEIAQTGYTGSVGDKKFNILLTTGHNYSDNELRDGYLYLNKSPSAASTVGDIYLIKDNKIITSDTVMEIEIADAGGLRTAFVATDELSVIKNPFRDIVVNPTTQAAMVVGVPLADVTANYYYWAQFRGICPLIVDDGETVVIGEPVGKPGTAGDAGACGVVANDGTDCVWGTVVTVGATDEPALVNLLLP